MSLPDLPRLRTRVPGPRSRALAAELAAAEAPGLVAGPPIGPVVWVRAEGASVEDADGNVLLDLAGGFGAAAVGHGNPRVAEAIREQAGRLWHGLGDVHPADPRVRLAQRLAALAPAPLRRAFLGVTGSEAVEIAWKTAVLATGRPGAVAFTGAYHGLTHGALALTDGARFRGPFEGNLSPRVLRLPYPDPYRSPYPGGVPEAISRLDRHLQDARAATGGVGAVFIEPVQYRGGAVAAPAGFLRGLAEACARHGALLVADEVATGLGRTGTLLACERAGVVPDLVCLGKALGGGLPISAVIGSEETMARWAPPDGGDALHTATHMGNPLAAAAALAALDEIVGRDLPGRAARLGERLLGDLRRRLEAHPNVGDIRGAGLLLGVDLVLDRPGRAPAPRLAAAAAGAALRRGAIVLPDGPGQNVLVLSPPLTISEAQADAAAEIVAESVREAARG
ncbi:MAG: aminotransferase class III-fold pyridoxal phosphate-dependent enzyme [Planctomycetales bacterium]|nr:aminotransferase class III-fold pyridoxal phosphate-dependent enzyme [Planctomycetales bacterium]